MSFLSGILANTSMSGDAKLPQGTWEVRLKQCNWNEKYKVAYFEFVREETGEKYVFKQNWEGITKSDAKKIKFRLDTLDRITSSVFGKGYFALLVKQHDSISNVIAEMNLDIIKLTKSGADLSCIINLETSEFNGKEFVGFALTSREKDYIKENPKKDSAALLNAIKKIREGNNIAIEVDSDEVPF